MRGGSALTTAHARQPCVQSVCDKKADVGPLHTPDYWLIDWHTKFALVTGPCDPFSPSPAVGSSRCSLVCSRSMCTGRRVGAGQCGGNNDDLELWSVGDRYSLCLGYLCPHHRQGSPPPLSTLKRHNMLYLPRTQGVSWSSDTSDIYPAAGCM